MAVRHTLRTCLKRKEWEGRNSFIASIWDWQFWVMDLSFRLAAGLSVRVAVRHCEAIASEGIDCGCRSAMWTRPVSPVAGFVSSQPSVSSVVDCRLRRSMSYKHWLNYFRRARACLIDELRVQHPDDWPGRLGVLHVCFDLSLLCPRRHGSSCWFLA